MRQCSAIKGNGEHCRGIAKAGCDHCPAHLPGRAEARKRAASRAARSKPTAELVVIRRRLTTLADEVLEGRISTARGSVAAQVLGVAVRTFEVERRLKESAELEERITVLEEAARELRKGNRAWR